MWWYRQEDFCRIHANCEGSYGCVNKMHFHDAIHGKTAFFVWTVWIWSHLVKITRSAWIQEHNKACCSILGWTDEIQLCARCLFRILGFAPSVTAKGRGRTKTSILSFCSQPVFAETVEPFCAQDATRDVIYKELWNLEVTFELLFHAITVVTRNCNSKSRATFPVILLSRKCSFAFLIWLMEWATTSER